MSETSPRPPLPINWPLKSKCGTVRPEQLTMRATTFAILLFLSIFSLIQRAKSSPQSKKLLRSMVGLLLGHLADSSTLYNRHLKSLVDFVLTLSQVPDTPLNVF